MRKKKKCNDAGINKLHTAYCLLSTTYYLLPTPTESYTCPWSNFSLSGFHFVGIATLGALRSTAYYYFALSDLTFSHVSYPPF